MRSNFIFVLFSEGCFFLLEWNLISMLFNGSSIGSEFSGGNFIIQVDDILFNIIDEGFDDFNIIEMVLEDGK